MKLEDKLIKYIEKSNNDWWNNLSQKQKREYLKLHPNSKIVKKGIKSDKKEHPHSRLDKSSLQHLTKAVLHHYKQALHHGNEEDKDKYDRIFDTEWSSDPKTRMKAKKKESLLYKLEGIHHDTMLHHDKQMNKLTKNLHPEDDKHIKDAKYQHFLKQLRHPK